MTEHTLEIVYAADDSVDMPIKEMIDIIQAATAGNKKFHVRFYSDATPCPCQDCRSERRDKGGKKRG